MKYSLGLDVGSVIVKLSLVDGRDEVVQLDSERITSNPRVTVNSLVARLDNKFPLAQIGSVGISGSGRGPISKELNWPEYSSSLAIIAGLLHYYPDARTIIQIGAHSSLVIELEDGLRKPWKVASNPLCAAGTGRFLEQQAYRLDISMDDFAKLANQFHDSPPRIAARCSVFAKTDLIHLQQKGVPIEAMLYALCESIARMVGSLKKGAFKEPVFFVGGVAANKAIIRALNEMLSARNGHRVEALVPENYLHIESIGAALLAAGKSSPASLLPETDARQNYFQLPRLENVVLPGNGEVYGIKQPCIGYLGVDVGSTSTKAVILDESGTKVLAKNYLMTAGRPVDAVKQVFRNLVDDGADKVKIAGVGVTGSGRYLVGGFIGADLIKNEITAQTRAAAEINPEADIIEIGGQDSKLVLKRNGVIIDYQMNKACAAGTGSFIDELAEMLGVSVKNGDFASLAFQAPYMIDLGTRCAAFMGQAVASAEQAGMPLEVLTASLSNSIARNYLANVVGTRKLGNKVILTGAVFYNQAVVSAFKQQLKDKELTVAEHREVSGAIGVALLIKESMNGHTSKFKGFKKIVDSQCQLSTFTCKGCDNNCAITRMQLPDEGDTYYGSRCDRYDSTVTQARKETCFDEREKLLFQEYKEGSGTGPSVGIPRALLVYDYAPLLLGFLNALGVRTILSSKTTREIVEQAVETGYSDSCFPLKLLHGHVAALKDKVDYILYPCCLRLGRKDGDENQKYACPLIQAAPFIIRHVFNLGEKLLMPIIDFSHGEDEATDCFAAVAVKLGFSRQKGRQAAVAGLEAQRKFEANLAELGRKTLDELHRSNKLGVVLLSRAYMSQDSGANLGIAEKLAQLDVVPLPLDFLPLASVDPKQYSDRPYWFYESKLIAGMSLVTADRQLYGLALTNFGCGPNSFILKLMSDITGRKPLGQLEIDEHAAEAGLVTRLEAFVDTIKSHASSPKKAKAPERDIYRGSSTFISPGKTLIVPRMGPFIHVLAASLNACGAKAIVLPEPDERNLLYSNQVTSGTECLPYRVTLGDFLRFCNENGKDLRKYEGLMASAYGPCRFGKYVMEQQLVLRELGFNLPIRATVANNGYRDINLTPDFFRLTLSGIFAVDGLQRLLWRTRPYEKEKGSAEALFDEYLVRIGNQVTKKERFNNVLRQATADFSRLIDPELPRRPLIGINGEIYLRSNRFSNRDLVKECEACGLEVVVSPVGEWTHYITHRHLEDKIKDRKPKKIITGYMIKHRLERDACHIARCYRQMIPEEEPSIADILAVSKRYLSPRCGSEAVLSIGTGVGWLKSREFDGVISVMPHGCMPGGIVAAMSDMFSIKYRKPWISVTYDGFLESNNTARVKEFAELVKFCRKEVKKESGLTARH
jgi:predicted CoA-substrate-specific enzyme activase